MDLSQVIYCGGYSGGVPPLPIPNREVKPAIADGTAPPGGRVGSCRSSKARLDDSGRAFLFSGPTNRWPGSFVSVPFVRPFCPDHLFSCPSSAALPLPPHSLAAALPLPPPQVSHAICPGHSSSTLDLLLDPLPSLFLLGVSAAEAFISRFTS